MATAVVPNPIKGLVKSTNTNLHQPLEFVPAKLPEAVTIKPADYIVVKSNDEKDEEPLFTAPALSTSTSSSPESSEPESEDDQPVEFYDLDDPAQNNKERIIKTWKSVTTPTIGLDNIGVTCFMNSAIQIMFHVPAMVHYLNDVQQNKYELPKGVTRDLAELLKKVANCTRRKGYVRPVKMFENLEDVNCMMDIWEQQDSHEYFQSLLGRLQEESTPKGSKLNTSIIHDIFGGSLHQTIQCSCGHVSTTYQDLYDLPLTFDESLNRAIDNYFKTEKMDNYTCEKCQKKNVSEAVKKSGIKEAPEYLAVHVKRYKHVSGGRFHKEKKLMKYGMNLDLTRFSSTKEPIRYKLVSVLAHSGRNLHSGHYTAYCRQSNGQWSLFDDEDVRPVREQDVVSQSNAYLLMYAKLTAKPSSKSNKSSAKPIASKKRAVDELDDIDKIFQSNKKRR